MVLMRYLVVVDMQRDFINGSLGTREAQTVLPRVVSKVSSFDGEVVCTMDTHGPDYLSTQEGRLLPVEHCIAGTPGWEIPPELSDVLDSRRARRYMKGTFGSVELAQDLVTKDVDSVEVVGLCTDICVVSNAMLLKAYLPEVTISVDASCCAGTNPERHRAALETMRSCQVRVDGD